MIALIWSSIVGVYSSVSSNVGPGSICCGSTGWWSSKIVFVYLLIGVLYYKHNIDQLFRGSPSLPTITLKKTSTNQRPSKPKSRKFHAGPG